MDLSKLTPDLLRELLKLSEAKSALQAQVTAVDARIAALGSGQASAAAKAPKAPKAPASPAAPTGKRRGRPPGASKAPKAAKAPKAEGGKRGSLKGGILELLTAAGSEGITVKEISAKLGVKNQNVHVWFGTTGKKIAEISKLGSGHYAYIPTVETAAAA